MSPRRTRAGAATGGQSSVSTRSKRQKINKVNDEAESIQRSRQSQRRSSDVRKNSLGATIKQSARKRSSGEMVMLKKSVKKKATRRRLNLTNEAETEDKLTVQNSSTDNDSTKILRNKHRKLSMTKLNLSRANTSEDSNNTKSQQKSAAADVKNSTVIVTPKSTPPKLSLTPHRSKKTPKKSPISLGSPKTHSLTIPKLLKSPRKLSLLTASEENLSKSGKSNEKAKKVKLNNSSTSHKSLTSPITKSNKKSDNLKTIIHKFSKSPKIVLRSPKSRKTKSRKLKLSFPSQKVRSSSSKTSPTNITSDTTPDLDSTKSKSTKKSPLPKKKNISRIKRQLIKALTVSQKKDVLLEPIVLLERLSPKEIQSILTINNKTRSGTSVRSPLINTGSEVATSIGSNTSINRKSDTKLRNGSVEKFTNRVSPRIRHDTPIQGKDRLSIPLLSSTPRENIPLTVNLSNTSIIDNTSTRTRSRHKNQFNISGVMHKSTDIEDISKPSLFDDDISNASQLHISNSRKQDTTYGKNNVLASEKEQENKKRNTYELEHPETLSLRQMIKKRTSTDANLSSKENFKRAKVHFAENGTFDTSNVHKSINKSIGLRSNISQNVNTQRNNISSTQKSRKVETPKFNQNSLASRSKTRSSPRTNVVTPRVQVTNGIQATPETFTLMEKKLEKKSSTKKVPNFGKIHEKMFAKSESLVDAKKRLEARHLALSAKKVFPKTNTKKEEKIPLPTDTKDGTHNRFGFKLRKNEATHVILKKQTTFSRQKQQHETRMTLKGVRTNRRFELQMKARNINP